MDVQPPIAMHMKVVDGAPIAGKEHVQVGCNETFRRTFDRASDRRFDRTSSDGEVPSNAPSNGSIECSIERSTGCSLLQLVAKSSADDLKLQFDQHTGPIRMMINN